MSITSLVDKELRADTEFQEAALRHVGIDTTNLGPTARPVVQDGAASISLDTGKASDAINKLVGYIPTETTTLYVAASSVQAALNEIWPKLGQATFYWLFTVLTPLALLAVYAGKRASVGQAAFPPVAKWPWWRMIAATIAFLVWALAVPGHPAIGDSAVKKVVAAFGAILVSAILSLLEPIVKQLFDRLAGRFAEEQHIQ